MTAATIAQALGGYRTGRSWSARCPAHDDHSPSLSVRDGEDGQVLVHCHAGCSQPQVIAALRERNLWSTRSPRSHTSGKAPIGRVRSEDADATEANQADYGLRLWDEATPLPGTLGEKYLLTRGITLMPPNDLRLHPALRHSSGETWPCIISRVTDGAHANPIAIHRTYLARDGVGKAPVKDPKKMLGPCQGGAVRLASATSQLMVGEGIETCLSAMQAFNKPTWAALSTSGLRSLQLPPKIQQIIILVDGDDAGEAAAQEAGLRWEREGRRVRLARARRGLDFNDILMGHATISQGAGK
jgi:putative DNA primase/helicase